MFTKPGIVVSLAVMAPGGTGVAARGSIDGKQVLPVDANTVAKALRKLWEATGCTAPDEKFVKAKAQGILDEIPAHQLPTHASLIELLNPKENSWPVTDKVFAAAQNAPDGTSRVEMAILQRHHDTVSLRYLSCDNNPQDTLTTLKEWGMPLPTLAGELPILGMSCVYFCELPAEAPADKLREFKRATEQSLRLPEHESTIVEFGKGGLAMRANSVGEPIGTIGGNLSLWIVGFPEGAEEGQGDWFVEHFFRSKNGIALPAGPLYELPFFKIAASSHKLHQLELATRASLMEALHSLNEASAAIDQENFHRCDQKLAEAAHVMNRAEDSLFLMKDTRTTIDLNEILAMDRASQVMAIRHANAAPSTLQGFVGDDFRKARQAKLHASGAIEYLETFASRCTSRVEFIRARLETVVAREEKTHQQAHEKFMERLHLLEVFIVTVYILEIAHLYHVLKLPGLFLGIAGAVIVLLYLYGLRGFTLHLKPHTRTILACAVLVTVPFIVVENRYLHAWNYVAKQLGWSTVTIEESKETDKPGH